MLDEQHGSGLRAGRQVLQPPHPRADAQQRPGRRHNHAHPHLAEAIQPLLAHEGRQRNHRQRPRNHRHGEKQHVKSGADETQHEPGRKMRKRRVLPHRRRKAHEQAAGRRARVFRAQACQARGPASRVFFLAFSARLHRPRRLCTETVDNFVEKPVQTLRRTCKTRVFADCTAKRQKI